MRHCRLYFAVCPYSPLHTATEATRSLFKAVQVFIRDGKEPPLLGFGFAQVLRLHGFGSSSKIGGSSLVHVLEIDHSYTQFNFFSVL